MANSKQNAAFAAPYEAFQAAGEQAVTAMTKAFAGYDELVALGKANLDAAIQVNTATVAGAQKLNTAFADYVKATVEANIAAAKALTGVKTVQEAVELQTGHVRANLDSALAKGSELSELALSVANDVAEPLQAQTKVAFDKLLKTRAA